MKRSGSITIVDINDGQPGHSPIITAEKNGDHTYIKVDGTTVATIDDGEDGVPVDKIEIYYYLKTASGSAPTSSTVGTSTIPDFVNGGTYYKRTVTYLDRQTDNIRYGEWVIDGALTSACQDAYDSTHITDALQEQVDAYITANNNRSSAIESQAKYFWWDSEGAHIASGVSATMGEGEPTHNTPSTYGFNALTAPGALKLRRYATDLAVLDTASLSFFIPPSNWTSSSPTGPKAMELSVSGLTLFNPVENSYVSTDDTTVTPGKEYFSKNGNVYTKITSPSGNPKQSGWYERVALMTLTTGAITFKDTNGKTQAIFGVNGAIQSGNYSRGTTGTTFANDGTKIDLTNGEILTKYFRLSQGIEQNVPAGVYTYGTVEALSGRIGGTYIGNNGIQRTGHYWEIGNYVDYNQNTSAIIRGHGEAFIQLNKIVSNSIVAGWRIATNRIHTAWVDDSGAVSGLLYYPEYNDKYWDMGLHSPISATDKLLYIRNASNSEDLEDLLNDLDDSGYEYWNYKFYVTGGGDLYAQNLYFFDENGNAVPVGGADGAYLPKTGGTITGNLEVNGTLTKGGKNVACLTATPTNGQILVADGTTGGIKTSGYTIATSVPQNAVFTDKNVQTTKANTTKIYLTGTQTNGTNTGTLNFDEYVYVDTTAGALHATTFNGYTLAAAAAKGVDTSMTASSTSTNLPTTKAVADLIATYLPLTGGTISGAVDINDELYADSATFGNLIVNGIGRFTNGIYGDLTGNASTATKVNNNLVIKLNNGTTEGTNMFTFNGSAAKTINVTKGAIGLGNVDDKSSATIRSELTSDNVTTALGFTPYNSTNPNGYVTSSGVTSITLTQGTGISIGSSGTAITTTGSRTIALADNYGDTKNPYASKTARYVLAAPANAAGVPTFRALTNADVGLGNVTNNKQVKGLSSGTTSGHLITWGSDGYTVADSGITKGNIVKSIASNNDGKLILTYADNTTSDPITVKIIGQEGSSVSYADKLNVNGVAVGSATVPVYFDENGEVQTANTIPKLNNTTTGGVFYAPTSVGSNGQVLKSNGSGAPSWVAQSTLSVGSATNDSDGNAINATYVKKAGDTITGRLTTAKPINQIITGTGTAGSDGGASASPNRYKPAKWTFNTNSTVTDGDIITIKIPVAGHDYGVYISIDNGSSYYPVVTSNASRLTTHYAVSRYITVVFEANGSADSMFAINGSDSRATVTGGVWRVVNYYDTNTVGEYAGCCTAGVNGMARYSLIIKTEHAKWESLVTTSTSATNKTKTNSSFLIDSPILYQSANTYTNGQNASQSGCWSTATGVDSRYSFNVSTTWSAAGRELYLVGTISNEKFTLKDTTWWADSLPSTNDGYYYWYVGQMYDGYRFNLHPIHPIYYYNNGIKIYQNASHISGYTVGTNVPSNAVFTDTWNALSTSQAGYVAKAPNDTSKFLRGDASWAAVTKANVGLGNVDNTADANKRVKGANITTTANAVTYYTDTTGTFSSKASANGALYATSANGTLNWGTLPIAQGGTGATTFTAGAALIGNGTNAIQTRSITNVTSGAVTASTNLVTANSLVAHVANKISAASDTYVTLTTAQTISGIKTFSNGAKFGTHWDISEDTTTKALVFKFVG